jgi:TPR repeat protein
MMEFAVPLAELGQPKPPQTPNRPPFIGFLGYAAIGLLVGIAAQELRWRSSHMAPPNQLAQAEKDAKAGDYQAAVVLFDSLAKRNNPLAEYWVAHMSELGLGVPRNSAKAIEFYTKAAAQDVAPAELRLGEMYLHGNLVLPDFAQAKSYLEKAAYHGELRAAMLLGQMYHDGIGMPADQTEAYAWSEVATLEGSAFAQRDRDISLHDLNEADQKSAIARAREILDRIKKERPPVKPPTAN